LDQPNQAKLKGRTIKESEARVIKLGAKGEKYKNQRCQTCGVADGHNSWTCLFLEENRVRLANLGNHKSGCPLAQKRKEHQMLLSGMSLHLLKNIGWLSLAVMTLMMII
jgi:hypothetical protein